VTPGTVPIDGDTLPRAGSSLERLAGLRPAFSRSTGTLTAGNSTPLTDGAAACWVASEAGLSSLPESLPRARLLDWPQAAIDPDREGLLIAPALAIAELLHRHGLSLEDIGLWEFHEAFAAQVVCTVAALEDAKWIAARSSAKDGLGTFPRDRINPNGGSVALGHPFGATGARILSQTVLELADRPAGTLASTPASNQTSRPQLLTVSEGMTAPHRKRSIRPASSRPGPPSPATVCWMTGADSARPSKRESSRSIFANGLRRPGRTNADPGLMRGILSVVHSRWNNPG